MKRSAFATTVVLAVSWTIAAMNGANGAPPAEALERVLEQENLEQKVQRQAVASVDDLAFLRRVSVDLIGRIPTDDEIHEYLAWPQSERRTKVVDKLMADERFADQWAIFFSDMLRLRADAEGGLAAIAFVNQAVKSEMPYDEMCRRLISASGKAGATPEVGFILGDNADPMALAGAVAQTFLGIRVACAQCHDHPFDVWTQEDFYGLAAYFGKTRRVESQFTRTVYTTEMEQTSVLWPPEGVDDGKRKPMQPRFPFEMDKADRASQPIARLTGLRTARKSKTKTEAPAGPDIDGLLAEAGTKANRASKGAALDPLGVVEEAKRDVSKIDLKSIYYRQSDLRLQLAELVTNPHNRFFSQSFVNRVWAELIGRGFVEPIDNFSESNPASHPQTLAFLADEFVASGFQLKSLVRTIVLSSTYARRHAHGSDEVARTELEAAFLATPLRRMLSEILYDSIITAGHVYDVKHVAGKNMKVEWRPERIAKRSENDNRLANATNLAASGGGKSMPAMQPKAASASASPYDLENAIELDFASLLKTAANEAAAEVEVEKMKVMSKEEIEAMRMQEQMQRQRVGVEYIDRFVKATFDDNPTFTSALKMASPVVPEHFLRVFGQTSRTQLGEARDPNPSMRQALMMLNGRLTHEASRVGELEPIYPLLTGKQADVTQAIRLAYRETLTREPTQEEIAEARLMINEAPTPIDGMADLRWILLNCNEFRFVP